jgi:ribonuclease R
MSKKRKSFHKFTDKRQRRTSRTTALSNSQLEVENALIRIVYQSAKPPSLSDIHQRIATEHHSKNQLKRAFGTLLGENILQKNRKNQFQIESKAPIYSGRLIQHPRGFGFVEVTPDKSDKPQPSRDPFIARGRMAGALHGDMVLIRILNTGRNNRSEATIITILDNGPDTLCGILSIEGRQLLVYPDDYRFPYIIKLPAKPKIAVNDGDAVKIRYSRAKDDEKFLSGKIVEVLGSPDTVDTQMKLVIEKFSLPHLFEEKVLAEANSQKLLADDMTKRRDLRKLPHITIDGETAKDFDDAITVIHSVKGFRLYVSIADVSHFVASNSALDKEAFARGTSVYFPGRVLPMLPEILSNDLCSLVPGEDRLTLTAMLDFNNRGELVAKDFFRSVIRSRQRFTYTTVKEILVEQHQENRLEHNSFIEQLERARELAQLLRERRLSRGAIDFDLAEPQFILTDDGRVKQVKRAERNLAHRIIEEFMLAANEAVAAFLLQKKVTPILRIHEPPDEEKLQDFIAFTNTLGLKLPPFNNHPSWFATAVSTVKGMRYEYIVNNLLLRSLSQARYSISDTGHFGLASPAYTHFTSPIRRYPDLMVHRQILAAVDGKREKKDHQKRFSPLDTAEAAELLSKRERNAVDAERDINERLKIWYMKDKVGEIFPAIISGMTENVLFIEIEDIYIGGAVEVESLSHDHYIHDAKNFRLFGEITARTYQLGDKVQVVLASVSEQRRKLTFRIAET